MDKNNFENKEIIPNDEYNFDDIEITDENTYDYANITDNSEIFFTIKKSPTTGGNYRPINIVLIVLIIVALILLYHFCYRRKYSYHIYNGPISGKLQKVR